MRGVPKTLQATLARKLCRDMKFAGSYMPRYRAAHRKWLAIMRSFERLGVVVQKKSIDEALLDLTKAARTRILNHHAPPRAVELVNTMKRVVVDSDPSHLADKLRKRQQQAIGEEEERRAAATHAGTFVDEKLGTLQGERKQSQSIVAQSFRFSCVRVCSCLRCQLQR